MRKVVLYTLMALDGAVDRPGRYFGAPDRPGGQPPEFDAAMDAFETDLIETQDAVLLGRGMYEEWSEFWPTVEDQPFADFINSVEKYVVTSSPLTSEWDKTEVVAQPVEDFVTALKARPGGDIGVHGSIELAKSLLRAGLVDELRLVVGPIVGCPGRRLFDELDELRLDLLSAVPTPTGSLLLAYRILHPAD